MMGKFSVIILGAFILSGCSSSPRSQDRMPTADTRIIWLKEAKLDPTGYTFHDNGACYEVDAETGGSRYKKAYESKTSVTPCSRLYKTGYLWVKANALQRPWRGDGLCFLVDRDTQGKEYKQRVAF